MDSRDIFRRFFGFPNRHPFPSDLDDDDNNEHPEDKRNNGDEGFHFLFGDSSKGLEGMFEHFHGDMWRQMEALHQQMEEMMRGFGAIDFHSGFDQPRLRLLDPDAEGRSDQDDKVFGWTSIPNPFFRQHQKRTPRDFMLKDGAEEERALPAPPSVDDRSEVNILTPVPRLNAPGTPSKGDTDLDGKISEDKLLEMIKQPNREVVPSKAQPGLGKPQLFSSMKSVSVTTIRGANNKVEQKRTVKDSSGREESTVTRSLGDKSYTVTTVTDKDGTQQRHESFKNMDESEIPKFEHDWNKKQKPRSTAPGDSMLSKWPTSSLDSEDKNLFSKLFGWKD